MFRSNHQVAYIMTDASAHILKKCFSGFFKDELHVTLGQFGLPIYIHHLDSQEDSSVWYSSSFSHYGHYVTGPTIHQSSFGSISFRRFLRSPSVYDIP